METQPKRARTYPPSFHFEIAARKQGEQAALAGESIHSCPHTKLPQIAAWRNGWAEGREARRRREDAEYQRAVDPPGMLRSSQIVQGMSEETCIERFGDRFVRVTQSKGDSSDGQAAKSVGCEGTSRHDTDAAHGRPQDDDLAQEAAPA